MARKRIGQQTPTQAVFLSSSNSLYQEAVSLYEKSGRSAQKWQVNLLKPLLARTKKGLWTHTKFGYSVPRRNGKNEVVAMRELYGLMAGERILHTAHRTTTSHAAWERLLLLLDKSKVPYESLRASGRERIELENGGRVEFRTRSSKGGLGEGFDLLVIDEAQEYTEEQESALKYVVTDSPNPQTLFCGTPPTPVSSGTVFLELRNQALQGSGKNLGWAEWGVEVETDPYDTEAWYRCNPSLGTVFTERSVEDEIGSDRIDFNIQRLGLWLKYNLKSAIQEKDWDALSVEGLPTLTGKLFAGIKYGVDGERVALSIASKTADDKVFIEAVDCQSMRAGNEWLIQFLATADLQEVVVDGAGAQALLANELKERGIRLRLVLPTIKEIIKANACWEQSIYRKTLVHMNQPSLKQSATNCEKRKIGTNGGFGYRSQLEDVEIALMDSALLAHWACRESKPAQRQQIRY